MIKQYDEIRKSRPALFNNTGAPFRIITDDNEITHWKAQKQSDLLKRDSNFAWAAIGVVFDDPFVVILRDLVEFADGSRNGYMRLYNQAYIGGGAAGVVMLPEMNGRLLLMHQFRHATRSWHWEIPRGFGEPGVEAEDQAQAEVEEEIGGDIVKMTNLGLYFNNTGLEGNPIFLYLVEMKSIGEPKLKFGVDEFKWVSVSELEKMIADGEITDGFTIAAYTRAKLKGLI